jgi:hypothetical protein
VLKLHQIEVRTAQGEIFALPCKKADGGRPIDRMTR